MPGQVQATPPQAPGRDPPGGVPFSLASGSWRQQRGSLLECRRVCLCLSPRASRAERSCIRPTRASVSRRHRGTGSRANTAISAYRARGWCAA
jgi:hypothetical protein